MLGNGRSRARTKSDGQGVPSEHRRQGSPWWCWEERGQGCWEDMGTGAVGFQVSMASGKAVRTTQNQEQIE